MYPLCGRLAPPKPTTMPPVIPNSTGMILNLDFQISLLNSYDKDRLDLLHFSREATQEIEMSVRLSRLSLRRKRYGGNVNFSVYI